MLRWIAALCVPGLLSCQATENAADAPSPSLEVGAFVVDLTPRLDADPVWMAGFGHGRSAEGVHDPIEARAIVFVNGEVRLALVAVDLIGLFHEEVLAARRLLAEAAPRWSDGDLIVAATHNHEGPDTMGLWGETQLQCGIDPEYNDRVVAGIVRAVLEAETLRRPARLRFGESRAPELLVDSRQPRIIDDRVLALRAVDSVDETIAALINFGCHPEAMGSRNRELTADYPFFTRRLVERELGGTAVFFSGAIGGLMTQLGLELQDPETGAVAPKRTFRFTEIYGEAVGRAALEALDSGRWSESEALEAHFEQVDLPLTNPFYKTGLTLGIIGGGRTASRLKETGGEAWVFQSEVGLARIGDAELLLVPGEIYPELVMGGVPDPAPEGADFPDAPIEPPLLPRLTADYRFLIGLAGDEIGYILPKRQWDQRKPFAYGLDDAPYGEINSVGPDAAAALSNAYDRLLRGEASDR
ncbi:MAG: neutral/alkaline non-lysosomal ceramidase N-terminal domain-containing protein [Planctomycetota bacterium]